MNTNTQLLCVRGIPEALKAKASESSITEADCLFSIRSDLAIDGSPAEIWLVVSPSHAIALRVDGVAISLVGEPIAMEDVRRCRCFQTIGSAFLQFQMDGVYVNVVRYSNSYREHFGRIQNQIQKMLEKGNFQEDALARRYELVCEECGLPLPGRGAACPRCSHSRGVFVRSLGLMRPYTRAIVLLLSMMLLGVTLDLLPPQLTRVLVDRVLQPRENLHWLPLILMGLVAASAGRCILNIFIGKVSCLVGTKITRELREQLQRKLVSLSVDYYNRYSVGSLMSRVLYDVDYFQGFVSQVAQGFLLNIMLVTGIGTMLFVMNWRLALLVLLPIPFVVLGTIFFWKHIYPRHYEFWDRQSKMAQLLSGLLSGIKIVKAYGQEDKERQRFSDNATYLQNARRRLEISSAIFHPIMGFIFGLGGLIIWYAGGGMVFNQQISLGTLMAFFGYLGMFYAPISALSMFSNWMTGFVTAGQRTFEILDSHSSLHQQDVTVKDHRVRGEIEFRNVTFGYDPYTPVLKNVSFRIESGQFVGIVGKSGSGKTSLINLISRFYDAQQGQVLVDGVDVQAFDPSSFHHQVGLVLQEPFLFRGTIAENIAYGRPDASCVSIMDAAKAANAHGFISRRAAAYDTRLGESGAGLSGGERQRISIARALLCDPRILILDEATSSVDTESEQEIQKALACLCKGRTTIAVAHRLSTLKNADLIFVIDEGRLVESGSHDELFAREDGIYHKLVKIQTELSRLEGT